MRLQDIIDKRILVLDGAMGTMIQKYGLRERDFRGDRFANIDVPLKGNNDILNLTRPDIISDIHRKYLEAGADLIETNTFSSQGVSQADYHLSGVAGEMALIGARIARKMADEYSTPNKPRFVCGSVGPTNKTCSMSPDVSDPSARDLTYDDLFAAYSEQMDALVGGGVDIILIETIFDTLNAKVAIDSSISIMRRRNTQIPIMLSVTVSDLAGRTLSGQTIDAFLGSVSGYPIFSVGLNCSFGAAQMKPYLRELARKAPYYISAYPNAGFPNAMGGYDETAESMSPRVEELIDEGLVNIVGGCCGTTDKFIASFAKIADGKHPHIVNEKPKTMWLSGLELLDVTPEVRFVNVGERCNVAGSRKFLRLINDNNYAQAVSIARKQVEDGALVLDINMDDGLLDSKAEMVNFINLIESEPDIACVPLMIDSSEWDVIVAGLKCCQGKCVVNSISLKEGERVFIEHARDVKRYGAACVVMCFDEQGQAVSYDRKIEIAQRAYHILTAEVSMNPLDIIFDPNVLAIATGMEEHDKYAIDFIKATEWIRNNLPGAHVSGGVSNLSFSFRGNNYIREAMHAVFLYHAIRHGMDFGIVNPATSVTYDDIPKDCLKIIEDVVLNRREGAAEDLINLASGMSEEREWQKNDGIINGLANNTTKKVEAWREGTLGERLVYSLRKGIGDYLDVDIHEALSEYPTAVSIIDGPLMAGMTAVGNLFGAGKMFLPQVVKTARTMRQAVSILQPYIEAGKKDKAVRAGKIVIATVKGDVHDIGKNIVAVVMGCNNYEVIDLGVMVPAGQIVKKAIGEQADMVGLSGLITPSLEEMVNVATEMERAGLTIPLLIGGATTSELYVALRIAPVYSGAVVWVRDAAMNVAVASRLLSTDERQSYIKELNDKYAALRVSYSQNRQKLTPLREARDNKLNLFD